MDAQEATSHGKAGRPQVQETNWNVVYAEQLPRIYNFLRFFVGNRHDAEELTSRTFEKAWRRRDQYRHDRAGFSAWLFGIARNIAVDHIRSHRVHLPIDATLTLTTEHSAEDEAARLSDIERLVRLTSRFPVVEQELIALKYGAELTNRDIARLTGLSESNVGTMLHRLVEKLRMKWPRGEMR